MLFLLALRQIVPPFTAVDNFDKGPNFAKKYKVIQKKIQQSQGNFLQWHKGHYTGQHCTDASQFFYKF